MLVICDTSPISNLLKVGKLDLLEKVIGQIVIPPAVAGELKKLDRYGIRLDFLREDWVKVIEPTDMDFVNSLNLDPGEAEAIALAVELKANLLVIDERAGYKVATQYKLTTVGLIGILIKAKQYGHIDSLKDEIENLQENAGFWLNPKFVERILKQYDK